MTYRQPPLSELLRPTDLEDLALTDATIAPLVEMKRANRPSNMLFYGPPGTGKSSASQIFMRGRGQIGTMKFSGASLDATEMQAVVARFAATSPFTPGLKIVLIDEADFLPLKTQGILCGLIETYSDNTRFILTANGLDKLQDALRSRLLPVAFGIGSAAPAVIQKVRSRILTRLNELGIEVDEKRFGQAFSLYFPDLRQFNNYIEAIAEYPTAENFEDPVPQTAASNLTDN